MGTAVISSGESKYKDPETELSLMYTKRARCWHGWSRISKGENGRE